MKVMSIDKAKNDKVRELCPVSILSALSVGRDRLHFGYEKMRKLAHEFIEQIESINGKYVSFLDLKECLTEDDGIDFPYDFRTKISGMSTKEMRTAAEYIAKSTSTAMLCTVLCDKFGMKKVKVNRAIKQFNDIFDCLKNDRQLVRNLMYEFERDYLIKLNI